MQPTNQSPPRFSTVEFDCELPPEVRTELLQPKRARMLGRSPAPPKKRSWLDSVRSRGHPALGWLLALIVLVLLGAVVYLSWPSPANRAAALQESAARSREVEQQADRALEALRTPAPIVRPTPTSMPTPTSTPVVVPTPAPRAALVKLPAPRAMLVGEPIPAAAQLFPSGRIPMWRQTGEREWTIWQPGNLDYIYIVDAQCTVSRANAIGRQARDFAPRAERLPKKTL